jgi:hypothetical protein
LNAHHPIITLALAVLLGLLSLTALQSRANAQISMDAVDVAVLIQTAVDLEQCDRKTFSMIDDIRFGMFVVRASGYETTLARTAATLHTARRAREADCTDDVVQKRIQAFASDVLPQIRSYR